MSKYGLTEERYNQLLTLYGDDGEVAEKVEDWGVENCNRGYEIFDFDGTGMLEVNKIDELCVFEDDEEAVEQAIKDGVKFIPIEELPENFDRRYLGWIDTEENRKRIAEYCSRLWKFTLYLSMQNTQIKLWVATKTKKMQRESITSLLHGDILKNRNCFEIGIQW